MNLEPTRNAAVSAVGQGRLAEARVFSASEPPVPIVAARAEAYATHVLTAVEQDKLSVERRSPLRTPLGWIPAQGYDLPVKGKAVRGVGHQETCMFLSM